MSLSRNAAHYDLKGIRAFLGRRIAVAFATIAGCLTDLLKCGVMQSMSRVSACHPEISE
jgi:hypothetical protein